MTTSSFCRSYRYAVGDALIGAATKGQTQVVVALLDRFGTSINATRPLDAWGAPFLPRDI
jgi:hypothetical protein